MSQSWIYEYPQDEIGSPDWFAKKYAKEKKCERQRSKIAISHEIILRDTPPQNKKTN